MWIRLIVRHGDHVYDFAIKALISRLQTALLLSYGISASVRGYYGSFSVNISTYFASGYGLISGAAWMETFYI